MLKEGQIQIILQIARKDGVVRPKDLAAKGIHRQHLKDLVQSGQLEQIERGTYVLTDIEPTENHGLVMAARKVPHGVICLLSALQFHGLTTQLPSEIWMTIEAKAWQPKLKNIPIRFARNSGKAFTEGIQTHILEGFPVKIYSPAKTVADCFKYRNKIGLDVAIEALRDCIKQKKASYAEIWRFAKICRITNVIKPYMEAVA
ncbi:MAG: AbiEi antitoxin N-terminal domain-containing protein [Phycisphaerae bacterium]|jgi:predicted transcriptional regulator of viral defense system